MLFDKFEVTNNYGAEGFSLEYERHVRVKIFKKSAYDAWANQVIFFFKDQRITDLKAVAYNLEGGQIVETALTKDQVFEEKLTKYRFLKRFAIPGIKEGSVLEFKYTLTNPGGIDVPNWTFQTNDFPTVWSEYTAEVPTFIEFGKSATGWQPFALAEDVVERRMLPSLGLTCEFRKLHFIQQDVPALKKEEFVGSANDYLSKISFDVKAVYKIQVFQSSISNAGFKEYNHTWEGVGEKYYKEIFEDVNFGDKISASFFEKCASKSAETNDIVESAYAYIGENFANKELDIIYPTQFLSDVIRNGKATPTERNLLLINVLQKQNLKAYPVLISTRAHGRVFEFRISPDEFDRMITAVETDPGKYLVIDASAWPMPLGLIPESDLNGQGLIIKNKKEVAWVALQNSVSVREAVIVDFAVQPEGQLKGNCTFSESGYGAVRARAKIFENNAEIYVKNQFSSFLTDGKVANLSIENLNNWREPSIKGSFELETTNGVTLSGKKIYLSPSLGLGQKINPFKNPTRKFDIDFGVPQSVNYSFSYQIPAGWTVEESPKPIKMAFGENQLTFEYSSEIKDRILKINVRQAVKKPYVSAIDYPDLRQYFSEIVKKMEEQVVLTKI